MRFLPRAVVFDLDDTLWAGEVDCTGGPPFRRLDVSQTIYCRDNCPVRLFDDVLGVFDALADRGVPVAYASRTWKPKWAEAALKLFYCGKEGRESMWSVSQAQGWGDCSKVKHLNEIAVSLDCTVDSFVFFDNEMRNIRDIQPLGTVCGYCPEGLTGKVFLDTLERYSDSTHAKVQ